MIPPMVRSVRTVLSGQACRAAEPLAVNTQLPSRAPTGSTATSFLPLLFFKDSQVHMVQTSDAEGTDKSPHHLHDFH